MQIDIMPLFVQYPNIWVRKAVYDSSNEYKKKWDVASPYTVYGGWNWWYYAIVSLGRADVPIGYTFKWIFYAWTKNSENVKYNTNSEGWYETENGLMKIIFANTEYDPDNVPVITVRVPAYNGETWYYWFDMSPFIGKTYTITYDGNGTGVTQSISNTLTIYPNNIVISDNYFIRTGYKFIGWGTNNNAVNNSYAPNSTIVHPGTSETLQLYAIWLGITCTITYNGNGTDVTQSTSNTLTLYPNNIIISNNNFIRTGYTFKEWRTSPSPTSGIIYAEGSTIPHFTTSETLQLYAIWLANIYTITYNGNSSTSGTTPNTFEAYNNQVPIATNSFTRTNYSFIGWGTNNNAVNYSYVPGSTIVHPSTLATLTLYAIWGYNVIVNYDANGGTGITNSTVGSNNFVDVVASNFNRYGYVWTSWNTNSLGTGLTYSIGGFSYSGYTNGKNYILYAQWRILQYKVVFNTIISDVFNTTIIQNYNTLVSFPSFPNFKRVGYVFNGWMDSNNITYYTLFTLTQDITLYAKWDIDTVSLSKIQECFGGLIPINISEYYLNGNYVKDFGAINIPTSGQISMNHFNGKYKTPYLEYMLPGNISGNMDETGGTRLVFASRNDGFDNIGTVGFSFFWFGTDYGKLNNIFWSTNSALTFNAGQSSSSWGFNTSQGIQMGLSDRYAQFATQFPPTTNNGYNIKRFIVNLCDIPASNIITSDMSNIQMEIRLLRGPQNQYIEIRMAKWTPAVNGTWRLSDLKRFINTFSSNPPITTGSMVLKGSLTGTSWVAYNNYYMNLPLSVTTDAITSMGANLVLRLDGYNIDGYLNSTLTSGSKIASWYNSGNTANLTTTQSTSSKQPIYNNGGGVIFSSTNVLISNINLTLATYSTMNIFVVWKNTYNSSNPKWLWSQTTTGYNNRTLSIIFNNITPSINIGSGSTQTTTSYYYFPINTTVVVNCEYNTNGLNGGFYINNNLKRNIECKTFSGTTNMFFGSVNGTDTTSSIDGIIYEIIIINKLLNETERNNIYNLLNNKWGPFYADYITIMGKNLIFRLDGTNIDARNNDSLTSGSLISYWYNGSGNTVTGEYYNPLTTQNVVSRQPTYYNNNTNGVSFYNGQCLKTERVNIGFENYIEVPYTKMNIFVVWKKTGVGHTDYPGYPSWLWAQFNYSLSTNGRSLIINEDTVDTSQSTISVTNGTTTSLTVNYYFPIYTTVVVNCEYNINGTTGKFYINNNLLGTFNGITLSINDYLTETYFGSKSPNYPQNCINGIIYEIIIINKIITDTERTNIYNLLNLRWGPFYNDAITSMGTNLVLRLDGYNIDGKKNSTLTSGSKIASWYNSGNTANLTTTQSTSSKQPIYNNGGGVIFSSTNVLISNINLTLATYSTMNIFVVWKNTYNNYKTRWLWSQATNQSKLDNRTVTLNFDSDYTWVNIGSGDAKSIILLYDFPINTTVVVNCEYNTNGLNGGFYINNNLKKIFVCTTFSGTTNMFFGSADETATYPPLYGIIYEIIIINKLLNETERNNIYNLLNNKWNVP